MKINPLRVMTLGTAGLVAMGVIAFQSTSAGADQPALKREEDRADVVLVDDEDDDDTFAKARDNTNTNSNTKSRSRNTGRDNSRTGANSGRDDSRSGRKVKDWTKDGPGTRTRDWSQNKTNDRSRHNTR